MLWLRAITVGGGASDRSISVQSMGTAVSKETDPSQKHSRVGDKEARHGADMECEEYLDKNFEWSFLQLTDSMAEILEQDVQHYKKTKHRTHRHHFSYHSFQLDEKAVADNAARPRPRPSLTPTSETSASASTPHHQTANQEKRRLMVATKVLPSLETFKELQTLRGSLSSWKFDIFDLNRLTDGHALQAVSDEIFHRRNLLGKFHLMDADFMRFILTVENHYKVNPYHNASHAADVLQTCHTIIFQTGLIKMLTDLEVFCLYLTALLHDVEHTGTNNAFHKNTGSALAQLYVVSVLENHHLRVGLRLLREYNILASLTNKQFESFKSMFISMILATDMASHFLLITNMKLMILSNCKDVNHVRMKRVLMMILHAADISNSAKPWDIHKVWVSLLMEEFFMQGDKERQLKLPVTPQCDRFCVNIATGQIGFMQTFTEDTFHVVDHLVERELISGGLPYNGYSPWQYCLEENIRKWSGKWNNLKYEQISDLLHETAAPRKSIIPTTNMYGKGSASTVKADRCCRCSGGCCDIIKCFNRGGQQSIMSLAEP